MRPSWLACLATALALASSPGLVAPDISAVAPNVRPWLLPAKDLPGAGWQLIPSSEPASGCFSPPRLIAQDHPGSLAREDLYNPDGSNLSERIGSWATPAEAARAWHAVNNGLGQCRHSVLTSGRTSIAVTVTAISLGRYGQLSSAYQISGNYATGPEIADYLLAQKGRALISVNYAVFGNGLNPAYVKPLFRTAVARVGG